MKPVLHDIAKSEDGCLNVTVSFGDSAPHEYSATYDGSDDKYKYCGVDNELFMLLSDHAYKQFGNCVVYQMELMSIINAFVDEKPLPELPAQLGTTSFCTLKPNAFRVAWNKFIIFLYKMKICRPKLYVNSDPNDAV
ncbi:hypothetical protein OAG76_01340 [Rubripirellula sp.]|nr:hypothetical protein [Rubripirellula sp.]MDB4634026.1 hypothetical protein [Rubripirellula sp.]MDC0288867.1 hypothetical protein [Rubripirellula sp.]MDC0317741.1 hypothetical protein [bacterium]